MDRIGFERGPVTLTAYDWVPDLAKGQVRDLRLRWALEEAGFAYDVDLVPQGTQGQPENLARQPFGQVPALTVGGDTIFESGACVWTIAQASDALLPADPAERARCLTFVFAALNTVEPPLSMMAVLRFFEMQPKRFEVSDPAAVAIVRPGARMLAVQRLAQLGDEMGGRDHLVADRFTVADLAMVSVLRIAEWLGILGEAPDLERYVALHTKRPAFARALAGQLAPFAENAPRYERAAR